VLIELHDVISKDHMRTDLYWIESPWPGRLAISPRPRGNDWLEDEVRGWKQAGVDVIASLLTADENADLGLTQEEKLCQAHGLQFFSFPIIDRSIPASRKAAWDFVMKLEALLEEGKRVVIHCRQGIGRATLFAICILIASDVEPELAIQRVSAARGLSVPETPEQRKWVMDFAHLLEQKLQV
jgi:hypothetical protein